MKMMNHNSPSALPVGDRVQSPPKKKILTKLKTTVLIQKESILANENPCDHHHVNNYYNNGGHYPTTTNSQTCPPNTPTTPSNTSQCSNQSNSSAASGLLWSFSQEYNKKQLPTFKNFKTKAVKGGFQSDWKATGPIMTHTLSSSSTTTSSSSNSCCSTPITTTLMTPTNHVSMMTTTIATPQGKKKKKNQVIPQQGLVISPSQTSISDQSPISLESVDSHSSNDLIWVPHSPTMNQAVVSIPTCTASIAATSTTSASSTNQTCHLIFSNLTSQKKKPLAKKRLENSSKVSTSVATTTTTAMNANPTTTMNSSPNFANNIVQKDENATHPTQYLSENPHPSLARIEKPAHKMSSSLPRKTRERITIQELLN
nr:unnamed protein product [Naegleria fowleri]